MEETDFMTKIAKKKPLHKNYYDKMTQPTDVITMLCISILALFFFV